MLVLAAILCFAIGAAHSYLGERGILIRLFRTGRIPHLFGGEHFTRGTLRFAWHITTFAWWGLGYLLIAVSKETANLADAVLVTIGTVFSLSGVFAFAFTKGRHLSWIVFGLIAAIAYYTGLSS